jgi:hypothetical protein
MIYDLIKGGIPRLRGNIRAKEVTQIPDDFPRSLTPKK